MIWVRDNDGPPAGLGGSFRTRAEAKAEERKLLEERESGSDLTRSKITVAEICQQYLDEKRNKVKASSLQRSQELLAHLLPLLGEIQAAMLRPAQISAAYISLQQGLAKRTVRHCHWRLHGALELAVNWGQIPNNAAARITPPEPDTFEGKALTHEEVRLLLAAASTTEISAFVWLALDSGARQGELPLYARRC